MKIPSAMTDGETATARPDWDTYGLEMAKTAALRADCTRRRVGAVLMLPDNSIAVAGYNGGPSRGPSCLAGECPRGRLSHEQLAADSDYSSGVGTCVALHAEWNVLLRSSWQQMENATLYVTCEPCHLCWTLIKGTKISRVVWLDEGEHKYWCRWCHFLYTFPNPRGYIKNSCGCEGRPETDHPSKYKNE